MSWSRPLPVASLLVLAACSGPSEPTGVAVHVRPASSAAWFDPDDIAVKLGETTTRWWGASKELREAPPWRYLEDEPVEDYPAFFSGLRAGETYRVRLPARFVHEPVNVEVKAAGVTNVVVPVLMRGPVFEPRGHRNEKILFINVTKKPWTLSWNEGRHIMIRKTIAPDFEKLGVAVAIEWKNNGQHRSDSDRRFDQAVLVIDDKTSPAAALGLVDAISKTQRGYDKERATDDERRTSVEREVVPDEEALKETIQVPAFRVRLAHARDVVPLPLSPAPGGVESDTNVEVTFEVHGTPSPDRIRSLVEAQLERLVPRLSSCYQTALVYDPTLRGTLIIAVRLWVEGLFVRRMKGSEKTPLNSERVAHCVTETLRGLVIDRGDRPYTHHLVTLDFDRR